MNPNLRRRIFAPKAQKFVTHILILSNFENFVQNCESFCALGDYVCALGDILKMIAQICGKIPKFRDAYFENFLC